MKKLQIWMVVTLSGLSTLTFAQQLDVEGKAKIEEMELSNESDSLVVRLPDGTLAIRQATSLVGANLQNTADSLVVRLADGTLALRQSTSLVNMNLQNSADSLVVRLADGTLALREASSLVPAVPESPWYLGKDTLDGIVCYLYKGSDGEDHGLLLSKIEILAFWQSIASEVGADRSWDGEFNTNLMINSPVRDSIIANFSSEWYLPSVDEWTTIWNNRLHVNDALNSGGNTLISQSATYWTSTEVSSTNAVILGSNSGSFTTAGNKTSFERLARAVRKF